MLSWAQQLAEKHKPVIYVTERKSDCGLRDLTSRPMAVEALFDNPQVQLRRKHTYELLKVGPTPADLFSAGSNAYLDLRGSPQRPGCTYLRDAAKLHDEVPAATYVHIVRQNGTDELALQYWYFFYFNDWTNNHEGDWEMIQLIFKANTLSEALTEEPLRVDYTQHNGGEMARWHEGKLRREGNRPVAYVAQGSNAFHFGPNLYIGRGEDRSGFGCDDASRSDKRVAVQAVFVPHEPKDADSPHAWVSYRGHWGELPGHQFDGPTGPIRKWQWWGPVDWEKAYVRSTSIQAPSPEPLGPNAVNAFCQGVARGSDLFIPLFMDRPVESAFILGAVCLGAVSSLAWTRFAPAPVYQLRTRRRLGQIMSAAMDAYLRRFWLVFVLGALTIGASYYVPDLRWRPTEVLPFNPLSNWPLVDLGERLVLVSALAQVQLGLVHFMMALVATSSLRPTHSSRTNLVDAACLVWKRLPALVLARLTAIVIVSALAFTVIGLPLALRQAVRWLFIEQTILLDGASARQATASSALAVEGRWWWTAGTFVAIGGTALAAAPILGVALILATRSLPLDYVNLISAIAYAYLTPYLAIALSLIYLELRPRAGVFASS
jgi:hypothetical protein